MGGSFSSPLSWFILDARPPQGSLGEEQAAQGRLGWVGFTADSLQGPCGYWWCVCAHRWLSSWYAEMALPTLPQDRSGSSWPPVLLDASREESELRSRVRGVYIPVAPAALDVVPPVPLVREGLSVGPAHGPWREVIQEHATWALPAGSCQAGPGASCGHDHSSQQAPVAGCSSRAGVRGPVLSGSRGAGAPGSSPDALRNDCGR